MLNQDDEEYKKRLEEAKRLRMSTGMITTNDYNSNNNSFTQTTDDDYQARLQEAKKLRNSVGMITSNDIESDNDRIKNKMNAVWNDTNNMSQNNIEDKTSISQINDKYGLGNIDLTNRQVVKNQDGSISTVRSISFQDDSGKEILIPTVVNGKIVSNDEAIQHYYKTGEYLGKFDTVEQANAYAEQLHKQQDSLYNVNSNQVSTLSVTPRRNTAKNAITSNTENSKRIVSAVDTNVLDKKLNEQYQNKNKNIFSFAKDLIASTVISAYSTIKGLGETIKENSKERIEMLNNMSDDEIKNLANYQYNANDITKRLITQPLKGDSTLDESKKSSIASNLARTKLYIEDLAQDVSRSSVNGLIGTINNVIDFFTAGKKKDMFAKVEDWSILNNSEKYGDYTSQEALSQHIQDDNKNLYLNTGTYNPVANNIGSAVVNVATTVFLSKVGLGDTASFVTSSALQSLGDTGSVEEATKSALSSYVFSKVLDSKIADDVSQKIYNGSEEVTRRILKINPELFDSGIKKAILDSFPSVSKTFSKVFVGKTIAGEVNSIMDKGSETYSPDSQVGILADALIFSTIYAGINGYGGVKYRLKAEKLSQNEAQNQVSQWYKTMGLDENKKYYSPDEMKKIYRNLAKKYHSDVTGGSDEAMANINIAYDGLVRYFNEGNVYKFGIETEPVKTESKASNSTSATSNTGLITIGDNEGYINTKDVMQTTLKNIAMSQIEDGIVVNKDNENRVSNFEKVKTIPFEVEGSKLPDIAPAVTIDEQGTIGIIDINSGTKLLDNVQDIGTAMKQTGDMLKNNDEGIIKRIEDEVWTTKFEAEQGIDQILGVIQNKAEELKGTSGTNEIEKSANLKASTSNYTNKENNLAESQNNKNVNALNMEDRTYSNVVNKNIKPYSEEHPEISQDIKDMAANFMEDLANSLPGKRYKAGDAWTGQKRSTTKELADFKDATGISWDKIGDVLNDIYEGKGNYALAKKMELELDQALSKGYRNIYGQTIMPNEEYLQKKGKIEGKNYLAIKDSGDVTDYTDSDFTLFMKKKVNRKVAENPNIEYNKFSSKLTMKEKNQIISEVTTWRRNQEDGLHYIDLSAYGYKSYIYDKQGNNVIPIKKVEGSQEFLNTVRKEIENGTFEKAKTINKWLEIVKNETKNNRSDNVSLSNRGGNAGNASIYSETHREQQASNRTSIIKKDNSNELKDSSENESSFSMRKKEITTIQSKGLTKTEFDNHGKPIALKTAQFFKDSKVRDDNGNLMVMYHGTEANVGIPKEHWFNTFDIDKAGNHGNMLGNGFYFTSEKTHAEQYAHTKGNIYEVYLNIKKPLDLKNFSTGDLAYSIRNINPYIEADIYKKDGTIDGYKVREYLIKNGYDGIHSGNTYVAFYSNQIKNINNSNPTTSDDIRYLKKSATTLKTEKDNLGRSLSKQQQEYFKNSKVRDENSKLMTVYHTTTDNISQFNEFNPVKTSNYRFKNQVVNYYTNSKEMSGSYANQSYKMADTKRLNSINDAKVWLEGQSNLLENFTIKKESNSMYVIMANNLPFGNIYFTSEEDLLKNLKEKFNAFRENFGHYNSKIQYEGYVNIKKPYIIDAGKDNWNNITETNIKKRNEIQKIKQNTEVREELLSLARKSAQLNKTYTEDQRIEFRKLTQLFDNLNNNSFTYKGLKDDIEDCVWFGFDYNEIVKDKGKENAPKLDEKILKYCSSEFCKLLRDAENSEYNNMTLKDFITKYRNLYEININAENKYSYFEREYRNVLGKDLKELKPSELFDISLYDFDPGMILDIIEDSRTTNDIVKNIIESNNELIFAKSKTKEANILNKNHSAEEILKAGGYDGVIIKNVIDYGGKAENKEPADLYITFDSNQFKAYDNKAPTGDADIRYLKKTDKNSPVDENIQKELHNRIQNALLSKNSRKNTFLGTVSEKVASKVKSLLGIDVSERKHILPDFNIRHIIKQHGNPEIEKNKGQIAITTDDIEKIPDIINNYDSIETGSINTNSITGESSNSIRYIKQYNDNISYVVEVVPNTGNTLEIKTMWKKPATLTNSNNAPSSTSLTKDSSASATLKKNPIGLNHDSKTALHYTSETKSNSGSNNNIPQNTENVNQESEPKEFDLEKSKTNIQREDSFIEQEIQKAIKNNDIDENIPLTKISDIVYDIEKYIGSDIELKHFRGRAYGIYKTNRDLIRVAEKSDLDTILHEFAHQLDYRLHLDKSELYSEIVTDKIQEDYANAPDDVQLDEGFAEVIRQYFTQPDIVEKEFPDTVKRINELRNNDKELDEFITKTQKKIYNYIHQTPEKRAKSNISFKEDSKININDFKTKGIEKAITLLFDEDYALKKYTKLLYDIAGYPEARQISASQDPVIASRLRKGLAGAVDDMVKNGIIDLNTGERKSQGLSAIEDILKDENMTDFMNYLVSLRSIEVAEKELKSGIRYDDAKAVVEKYKKNKSFEKARKVIEQYNNALLDYAKDSGLYSKEDIDLIKQSWLTYVPFQRVIDNGTGKSQRTTGNPLKTFRGSDREIINPLEGIIMNTVKIVDASSKNEVIRRFYNLGEEAQYTAGIYDVIPPPVKNVATEKLSDFKGYLAKQGVELSDEQLEKAYKIFYPDTRDNPHQLITSFMNDGERIYLQFKDENLYKIFTGMNRQEMNLLQKYVGFANSIFKAGTTGYNLAFAIPNILSDTQQAFVTSEANFVPLYSSIKGVYDTLVARGVFKSGTDDGQKMQKIYSLYLQSGASGAGRTSTYRKDIEQQLVDIYKKKYKDFGLKQSSIEQFKEIAGYVSEISEEATRFENFVLELKKNLTNKMSYRNAVESAAVSTRRLTQDFAIKGSLSKQINAFVPYFSARLGGYYNAYEKYESTLRNAQNKYWEVYNKNLEGKSEEKLKNPETFEKAKEEANKAKMRIIAKPLLTILALLAFNTTRKAVVQDDKNIQELSEQKKMDNYVFPNPLNAKEVITAKKPQGALKDIINSAEFVQDLVTGNIEEEKVGDKFVSLISSILKNNSGVDDFSGLIPPIIKVPLEIATNKDWYFNSEIVKDNDLQNLKPEDQYYEYNTNLSIKLGKILKKSPAQIDFSIRNIFGQASYDLWSGFSSVFDFFEGNQKADMGASDKFILKRFFANPNNNSESVTDLYNKQDELTVKKNYNEITPDESKQLENIQDATSIISNINKKIKATKNNSNLSSKEKGEQIYKLQQQRTDTARQALGNDLISSSSDEIESSGFYPRTSTLSSNGYSLTLTNEMKTEYEKLAYESYQKYSKQNIYSSEYLQKIKQNCKNYAKQVLMKKYQNKLVKSK